MNFPKHVKIVEVSPRDGLQNEPNQVPTNTKIDFINKLSETGLKSIEVTSFVSPKWIPQLADASEVFTNINKKSGITYPVLIPNIKGMESALQAGVKCIAVFTAASNTFTEKNTTYSINESLNKIAEVIAIAKKNKISIRGYISCCLGCPYEGDIKLNQVVDIAQKLYDLGCYEISLGDTIGVGTPFKAKALIDSVTKFIPINKVAVHFHDTYGQALANIYAVLEHGISIVDSSIAGLGGCPYAKGASGNVATEDVLYMLNGMEIKTGVSLEKICQISKFVAKMVGHSYRSKVALAKLQEKYNAT